MPIPESVGRIVVKRIGLISHGDHSGNGSADSEPIDFNKCEDEKFEEILDYWT